MLLKIPKLPVFKPPPVTYANAEVRGRLRAWKQELARKYHQFDCAYHNRKLMQDVADFAHRGSVKGRRRAFAKIQAALGPAPTLEYLDIEDKRPIALWSVLHPREAVAVNGDPGMMQDCICINYVIAGEIPLEYFNDGRKGRRIDLAEGLWTLEIPDHALGRAVERSGLLPDQIIRDAHRILLSLPAKMVPINGKDFLLKAGAGAFVCQFNAGRDVSLNDYWQLHVRAPTWLSDDMLGPDQVGRVLSVKAKPGEALKDTYLRPRPFLKISQEPEGLKIELLTRR